MCGRYQFNFKKDEFQQRFDIEGDFPAGEIKSCYNVTPGLKMPVVVAQSPNSVKLMLWGLIPEWDKSDKPKGFINLRDDTIINKKWAWKYLKFQRCLVPANGFYEWRQTDGGKIPYYIHLPATGYFSFAGLYSQWHDQPTYTIITTSPNNYLEKIHHRMPVILTREEEKTWLDPDETEVNTLKILLKPFPGKIEAYPISTRVNSPVNDDESLLKPAA